MTKETIEQVLKFRDERNWKQFHNPKDLAISISLEAAELLEVFQWSAEDVWCGEKKDKIREELADVLNYCILMPAAWIWMRSFRKKSGRMQKSIRWKKHTDTKKSIRSWENNLLKLEPESVSFCVSIIFERAPKR